nr:hypothetical protein [Tanacetum cinerariifolium]
MKILDWMISEEMKQTEHYRMYAEVFRIDVPLTQSQPTESTQGTHKTPSAPRSTRLTPPAPVPMVDKADELLLQDTLQMVEGQESVVDESSIPKNVEPNILGTRLEPRSDMESPEVEFIDVVIPVNVYDEEEEEDKIIDEVYELKRREKWMNVEESRITPFPTPIRSLRIHTDLELQGCYGYLFEHLRAKFTPRKSFVTLADHLHEAMADSLPTMIDKHIKEKVPEQQAIANDIPSQVDVSVRSYLPGHILHVHSAQPQTTFVPKQQYQLIPTVHPRDHDDPHDNAHPKGENSAKRQKTSEYEAYVSGESSFGQDNVQEQGPSTSGDEHQYHIDQMNNFLKSEIVWESRKEILVSPYPRKTTPIVPSYQRDPEAPTLSLINQDLLYLKKGNSGPEKIVLSLHKFPVVVFNDDDIEERTSRWIFYIRKQKEPVKPKEVIYSNSKIIQVIKTYWELGHEHKFITEIIARRANKCIVSITKPDFKNLNKNDIEDMYLLIMNSKKVNLTAPTISFLEIEKHAMFSIIYEPVHGIIYKNRKKEKRVMRHSEIHKFCDATPNRVLEGLKSYNNDVKYGYIQRDLTNNKVEYL